jgi:hypothetical protein
MQAEDDFRCRFAKCLKLMEGFLDGKNITPRVEEDVIHSMGTEEFDKGLRPIIYGNNIFH